MSTSSLAAKKMESITKTIQEIKYELENCNNMAKEILADKAVMRKHLDKILEIVTNLPSQHPLNLNGLPAIENADLNTTYFPIDSHAELVRLEENLNDEEFRSGLTRQLSLIADKTEDAEGYFVPLELSEHLFNLDFLSGYTFEQQQPKQKTVHEIPFNTFENVLDLFFNVVLLADKTYTKLHTEEFFKNHCLNNCDLDKNRKRKLEVMDKDSDETSNDGCEKKTAK